MGSIFLSPLVALIGDTCGIGGSIQQLDQTTARESIGFEDVLHGLVVRVRIRTHVAVMFKGSIDAVLGGTFTEPGRGDAVDGHIWVVIQPGTVNVHIGRINA